MGWACEEAWEEERSCGEAWLRSLRGELENPKKSCWVEHLRRWQYCLLSSPLASWWQVTTPQPFHIRPFKCRLSKLSKLSIFIKLKADLAMLFWELFSHLAPRNLMEQLIQLLSNPLHCQTRSQKDKGFVNKCQTYFKWVGSSLPAIGTTWWTIFREFSESFQIGLTPCGATKVFH